MPEENRHRPAQRRCLLTGSAPLLMLLAVVLGLAGCIHDAEVNDHLSHEIPEHKPATYRELATELNERFREFLEAGPFDATRQSELSDIINWVPELAADSDLRRTEWEQAVQHGRRLRELFDQATPTSGSPPESVLDAARAELNGLLALIPASERLPGSRRYDPGADDDSESTTDDLSEQFPVDVPSNP